MLIGSGMPRYKAMAPTHSNTVTTPQISLLRFVSDWKMPNSVYTEMAIKVSDQMLKPIRVKPVALLCV